MTVAKVPKYIINQILKTSKAVQKVSEEEEKLLKMLEKKGVFDVNAFYMGRGEEEYQGDYVCSDLSEMMYGTIISEDELECFKEVYLHQVNGGER